MEHIKVSMTPKASISTCHVTQNDNGREVSIDFEDYTLTGAEDVALKIRKPDGELIETALENTASDFVIWSSDPSECDVVGLANCEIKAEDDGVVLYSASFNMNIEADPYGNDVEVRTASGPIATFETNLADNLQSLKATINASGGGGTPDNPIPIVGFTECNITNEDGEGNVIDEITIDLNGTRYGGYVDVNNGKLVVTMAVLDLGTLDYAYYGGRFNSVASIADLGGEISGDYYVNVICDSYENSSSGNNNTFFVYSNKYIYLYNSDYTDAAAFKTSLSGVMLAYELATPLEIDISPEHLYANVGQNNVFHDCNGDTEVKYLYKG